MKARLLLKIAFLVLINLPKVNAQSSNTERATVLGFVTDELTGFVSSLAEKISNKVIKPQIRNKTIRELGYLKSDLESLKLDKIKLQNSIIKSSIRDISNPSTSWNNTIESLREDVEEVCKRMVQIEVLIDGTNSKGTSDKIMRVKDLLYNRKTSYLDGISNNNFINSDSKREDIVKEFNNAIQSINNTITTVTSIREKLITE